MKAEFDCTILSFTKMSNVWNMLAAKNATCHSSAAYVHKQATFYHALAEDCWEMYEKAIALEVESSSNVSILL